MRIGFIGEISEEDLKFASEHGFASIELVRDSFDEGQLAAKERQRKLLREYGIDVSAIGLWRRNPIHPDPEVRGRCHKELRRIIEYAGFLEAPVVITSGGVNPAKSVSECAADLVEAFKPILSYAKNRGVRLALYNCRGNGEKANFAHGPEAWNPVFKALPDLGIKYDPSHPYYEGKDYLREMRDYGDHIYHVHAKGALTIGGRRFEDPPAGMDDINWGKVMAILYHHGYRGDISIEPHSPTWKGEMRYKCILLAQNHLKPFII